MNEEAPLAHETQRRSGFGQALSWAYVQNGGRMVGTLLVSLLLARLLGPEAFGIIAMAGVYVFFIETLVRQGLSAALVQRPDLRRSHLDTAFWMIVAASLLLVPVSIGLSGWWAAVNRTPALGPIIVGLTPVLPLRGLCVVQESLLRRQMDYRALALRTNVAVVAGGVAGVVAAFAGLGTWSLVVQQVVLASVELVALWYLSDWRPRLRMRRERARDLLGFSSLSALAGMGSFLQARVDALTIGVIFGPVAVGLYRLATRLTDMVVEAAGGAFQSVSLSELSRLEHAPDQLARRTTEILRLASVVAVPVIGLLLAVSEPLLALLGPDWMPAVTALRILCLAAWLQIPAGLFGPVLQAAGRPGLLAISAWLAAVLSATSFLCAGLVLHGRGAIVEVAGLAVSRVIALVVLMGLLILPILHRVLRVRAADVARATGPVSIGVGAAALATLLLAEAPPIAHLDGLVALATTGLIGAVLIAGTTLAVEPMARDLFRRLIEQRRATDHEEVLVGPHQGSG